MVEKPTIKGLIYLYANQYHVSPLKMLKIVKYESRFNPNAIGDMKLKCPSTGLPVRSRGIVQISECYHPEVTDSEAFDPDFSIQFLAKYISEGKCHEWSTCKS